MTLLDKISDQWSNILLCTLVGSVVAVLGNYGVYGTRDVKNVHAFRFQGIPGVVKVADVRFGPDRYWIELADMKLTAGSLITDEGKEVNLSNDRYGNGALKYKLSELD